MSRSDTEFSSSIFFPLLFTLGQTKTNPPPNKIMLFDDDDENIMTSKKKKKKNNQTHETNCFPLLLLCVGHIKKQKVFEPKSSIYNHDHHS